jgi:hypothetical protein
MLTAALRPLFLLPVLTKSSADIDALLNFAKAEVFPTFLTELESIALKVVDNSLCRLSVSLTTLLSDIGDVGDSWDIMLFGLEGFLSLPAILPAPTVLELILLSSSSSRTDKEFNLGTGILETSGAVALKLPAALDKDARRCLSLSKADSGTLTEIPDTLAPETLALSEKVPGKELPLSRLELDDGVVGISRDTLFKDEETEYRSLAVSKVIDGLLSDSLVRAEFALSKDKDGFLSDPPPASKLLVAGDKEGLLADRSLAVSKVIDGLLSDSLVRAEFALSRDKDGFLSDSPPASKLLVAGDKEGLLAEVKASFEREISDGLRDVSVSSLFADSVVGVDAFASVVEAAPVFFASFLPLSKIWFLVFPLLAVIGDADNREMEGLLIEGVKDGVKAPNEGRL